LATFLPHLFICVTLISVAPLSISSAAEDRSPREANRSGLPTSPETPPGYAGIPFRVQDAAVDSADTLLTRQDTTRHHPPPPPFAGSMDRSLDTTNLITHTGRNWLDHRYIGDLLENIQGVFVRNQYSAGQYNQMNNRGADWRSIAVLANGRGLNDPASGIYNLFHMTSEYADRIETVTGPRAFLYGLNSAGGAVNVVTKNYNNVVPFTKVDYAESAYGYQYIDGTFSQNPLRDLNLMVGFQTQSTDGRYQNSFHHAWNLRAKLRYALLPTLNAMVSIYSTWTRTDLNGGVDAEATDFDDTFSPVRATVVNLDSYEKIGRHDVDLSFVGTFLGDENTSVLTLYYSHNVREYRDEENRPQSNGVFVHSDHVSSWMGGVFTQNVQSDVHRLSFGGTLELRAIDRSPNLGRRRDVDGALWAKEELTFGQDFTLAGFARYDRYLNENMLGYGLDVSVTLAPFLTLYGGGSRSQRGPNYPELYWTDSTVARIEPIEPETHQLIEGGARGIFGTWGEYRLSVYERRIHDPILFAPRDFESVFPAYTILNGNQSTTRGIEASIRVRVGFIYAEGTVAWLEQKAEEEGVREVYPKILGHGGLYYWDTLLGGKLELKTGIQGRYLASSRGELFNPRSLAYVINDSKPIASGYSIDFFLTAHIGDAYVHVMWENLTGSEYFSTPYYAALDRALKIGVFWEFLN
jgi:outer membrane cobalamin receptor